jgi:hypothetical protein
MDFVVTSIQMYTPLIFQISSIQFLCKCDIIMACIPLWLEFVSLLKVDHDFI